MSTSHRPLKKAICISSNLSLKNDSYFNGIHCKHCVNKRLKIVMSATIANRKNCLKVVILGDGGVGKSCLMSRFVSNKFDNSFHTVGVELFNKDIEVNGECYTLQLWDTAGQERYKSLRTPFYRGTDICMLTYSVDNKKSFNNLSMWRDEFVFYAGIKDSKQYPFLVVGSKIDLASEKREVEESDVLRWCEENGHLPRIETSAKDAINVEHAFALAVVQWNRLEEFLEKTNTYIGDTVNLKNKRTAAKTDGDRRLSTTFPSG